MWQIISNNFICGLSLFFVLLTCLYFIQVNRNNSSDDFCINQNYNDQSSIFSDKSRTNLFFNDSYQSSKSESFIQAFVINYKLTILIIVIFALTLILFWKNRLDFLGNRSNNVHEDRKVLRFIDCIEDTLRKKYDLFQMKTESLKYQDRLYSSSNCDIYRNSLSNEYDYNKESDCNNSGHRCSNGTKKCSPEDIIFSAKELLLISTDITSNITFGLNSKDGSSIYDVILPKNPVLSNYQTTCDIPNPNNNNNNNNIESATASPSSPQIKSSKDIIAKKLLDPKAADSNPTITLKTNIQNNANLKTNTASDDKKVSSTDDVMRDNIINEIKDVSACELDEDTLIEDAARCLSSEVRKLWPKVVQIIAERELSITKRIVDYNGQKKVMWAWTPYSLVNNKNMWQGPAVYAPIKINPPTPCLKIRNIIDRQFIEQNKEGWDKVLLHLLIEKVHLNNEIEELIFSEEESCVCVKCVNEKSAGKIFESINGWWFSGKLVSVKFLPLKRFNLKKKKVPTATLR